MAKEIGNKRHKAIQDRNRYYNLLSPVVQFGFRCHYRSFVVRGRENLPTDGSYIIAPCHQQALMEPLAVLCFAPKSPVFLARADLFNNPTLRKILTFLKIMPVYRIRDGQDQLGRNQEIFDRCRDVLVDDFPLCMMAEGRHNNRHHLLPLLKGMFRIAGEAQLALGERPLYIVPTGIDFDEYEKLYSNVVVNIGKPIPVQPFMESYRANEPLALNQMRTALAEALRPLMHDIRSDEHYEQILTLCNMQNPELRREQGLRNNAWNRFRCRQQIAFRLEALAQEDPAAFEEQMKCATELQEHCRRLGVGEKVVAEHWTLVRTLVSTMAVVGLLAGLALWEPLRMLALFALVCYPLPLIPTHLVVRRLVKDPQFRSSFNWGVRFLLSIVYIIAMGVTMTRVMGWYGLIAVLVAIVEARLTAYIVTFARDLWNNVRYWVKQAVLRRSKA